MRTVLLYPFTGNPTKAPPPPAHLMTAVEVAFLGGTADEKADPVAVSQDKVSRDMLAVYDQLIEHFAADADGFAAGTLIVVAQTESAQAKWNALEDQGWTTLVALLILAFPEFRWVLINVPTFGIGGLTDASEWSLTDATGVREWVKKATKIRLRDGTEHPAFPHRPDVFVSLDEEQDYAFFNAYTAYRFGYRAAAPLCWNETQLLLKSHTVDFKPKGVLEDVFLQYADQPLVGKVPLSYLRARDAELPALKSVSARVMVTSGGQDRFSPTGGDRERENDDYAGDLMGQGCHFEIIGKPLAGMFRLWAAAKMPSWLERERDEWRLREGMPKRAVDDYEALRAPGYIWPPKNVDDDPGNHSAPGRLLMVARTLLERAEKLLGDGVTSVEQAVQGAVLASEALEMLGDRTPTSALEALAVKHQFEVLAECQFIGVRHNIEVWQRIEELRYEINAICRRFAKSERRAAELDAEVAILGKLVQAFQDHNQFNEEMKCLYWQRNAMANLLQERSGLWGNCVGVLWHYLNLLVRGPGWFISFLAGWLMLGALLFSIANVNVFDVTTWVWSFDPFGWAADAFFAGNAPGGTKDWAREAWAPWIARSLTIMGLFHFGVFISYVYTLISRK